MSSLLADSTARVAHYWMQQNPDAEHHVATLVAAIHNVYFPEKEITNCCEKPPTNQQRDRRRRVDAITHWHKQGTWEFKVGAVWEFKKPNATPSEIETCEGQVLDACERYLADEQSGACFGYSVIGSFWRVFKYEKPGPTFACITGEGESNLKFYFDISDEAECKVIDQCLRDLREHMGFDRHTIRADAMATNTASTLTTESLRQFHDLKRKGWKFETTSGRFMRFRQGAWQTHHLQFPTGLAELQGAC